MGLRGWHLPAGQRGTRGLSQRTAEPPAPLPLAPSPGPGPACAFPVFRGLDRCRHLGCLSLGSGESGPELHQRPGRGPRAAQSTVCKGRGCWESASVLLLGRSRWLSFVLCPGPPVWPSPGPGGACEVPMGKEKVDAGNIGAGATLPDFCRAQLPGRSAHPKAAAPDRQTPSSSGLKRCWAHSHTHV